MEQIIRTEVNEEELGFFVREPPKCRKGWEADVYVLNLDNGLRIYMDVKGEYVSVKMPNGFEADIHTWLEGPREGRITIDKPRIPFSQVYEDLDVKVKEQDTYVRIEVAKKRWEP